MNCAVRSSGRIDRSDYRCYAPAHLVDQPVTWSTSAATSTGGRSSLSTAGVIRQPPPACWPARWPRRGTSPRTVRAFRSRLHAPALTPARTYVATSDASCDRPAGGRLTSRPPKRRRLQLIDSYVERLRSMQACPSAVGLPRAGGPRHGPAGSGRQHERDPRARPAPKGLNLSGMVATLHTQWEAARLIREDNKATT